MELDSIDWDPLTIKVKIPTRPKVELGNYRDIRLEPKPVEVTEDEVEQALENMQEQAATWAPVERPAEISDLISMSVVEKDGDEILAQRDSAEYELTTAEDGDDSPDLTTPLLGLSAGDEKIFTLTYPEDFGNEQYAGKDITFEVKVSSVKVKEVDPLDDEFAKSIGDFETLEELEEDLRENIRQQHEMRYNRELGNQALDKIIENAEVIDWPLALEEENIDQEMKRYGDQLESSGLTMEGYLRMQEKTEDEFREETRESVTNRLKRSLVLGKVAELENLEVSESEILERAKLIADFSGLGDQFWREILASQAQQNVIANELIVDKVVERLAMIAKGETPEEPEAELIQAENDESTESDEDEVISEPVSSSSEVTPDETETDASPTDVDKN
jgi:trigger factor